MDPTLNQNNQAGAGAPVGPTPVNPTVDVAQPVQTPAPSTVTPAPVPLSGVTSQEPIGDVYVPPTGVDQMTGPGATDIFASVDPVNDNPEPITPPLSEPKPVNMGNMEPSVEAETASYGNGKKSMGKLLKIFIPLLIVVGLLAGGGLFYIKSQKTSVVVLKGFSDATSGISSQSAELNSAISKVAYGSASDDLDSAVKNYDDAVAKFGDATSKLKSDRKALKTAAENYIVALKDYRQNAIGLALDARKVAAVNLKIGVLAGVVRTHSTDDYGTYLDESLASVKGYKEELTALKLTNETAKVYRDASVELADNVAEVLEKMKTANAAGDQVAVDSAKATFATVLIKSSAVAREKDISNALSYTSDVAVKLDGARKILNDEITKVKY